MATLLPGPNASANALLEEWKGPYGGVPGFDRMKLEELAPAMEQAMEEHLRELAAIAGQPSTPTFDNTIVAMERSGQTLDRVFSYYGIWRANLSSPEFRDIQRELAPRISAHRSQITQNAALFARIRAVYESDDYASLRPDQQRLVWLIYSDFERDGAQLEGVKKQRYAEIQARLAELYTAFSNNVLADEEGYVLYLDETQLGGLGEAFVSAAAKAATDRGQDGKYAILNTRSSMAPFLTFSTERGLRETVWRSYYARGDNGDANDNNAIIAEILKLRDERVGLLGYENFASWRLEDRMAKTPEAAMQLMQAVWPAAVARVKAEVADMQALADAAGEDITIEPWDYRFYMEQVRRERYDLDSDEVKQYLQLDRLVGGMHYVAGELFGYRFVPVPSGRVPVFHEDVVVYEVRRRDNGSLVGLWYLDAYARPGKRSGAWATVYRGYDRLDGEGKVILAANNSNFIKGAPGEPVLISWSDAETLFHEFGHALHYLSADVEYPGLNGGVRDYTEFQSQLLERWILTRPVIDNYLVHAKTGKPIPAALIEKLNQAATFNQGFSTTEYLASALIDMMFHSTEPDGIDPDAFEKQALEKLGAPREVPMRHRSPQFGHIFSGEGYAAGYYGYLWADVLTADAAEAFENAPGGFYDKELAARLVRYLFAVRNAVDPAEAYRAFRGRDANIDALMRARGFPVPGPGPAPKTAP
jgi:peptidyl-dipeptidase Dcp